MKKGDAKTGTESQDGCKVGRTSSIKAVSKILFDENLIL